MGLPPFAQADDDSYPESTPGNRADRRAAPAPALIRAPRGQDAAVGALVVVAASVLPACGQVLTSEDVPPGTAAVIGVVVVVALLYIAHVGGKGR